MMDRMAELEQRLIVFFLLLAFVDVGRVKFFYFFFSFIRETKVK